LQEEQRKEREYLEIKRQLDEEKQKRMEEEKKENRNRE